MFRIRRRPTSLQYTCPIWTLVFLIHLAAFPSIRNSVLGLNIRNIDVDKNTNSLESGSERNKSLSPDSATLALLPSLQGSAQDEKTKDIELPSAFSREILDQLTTNNPCLVHYCPKGRECTIESTSNRPICICQRYCSHRKRPICGSDGLIYENHCELHRAACLQERQITYQRFDKCPPKAIWSSSYSTTIKAIPTSTTPQPRSLRHPKNLSTESISNRQTTTITPLTQPGVTYSPVSVLANSFLSTFTEKTGSIALVSPLPQRLINWNESSVGPQRSTINDIKSVDDAGHKEYCSSQEYEIMKDNLLLYSHARLMSQDNNHSRDFLVSIMFSHYDRNNNGHLEIEELSQVSINEHLDELSNGCVLDDMLNFDDTNHDGRLSINEFYQAFSKLYSVSVVSLDKALETNHLSARVDDNVEIKCDVTGSPSPQIIWHRNGVDLSTLNEDEIRIFSDGSLYLTRIQLLHAGNYTCHAQRNKDIVQTHMLSVYTMPEVRVMPRIQSKRPGESAEMYCHVIGDPFPKVEWLKNDERIELVGKANKYQVIGNGTALKIRNIAYSDTGAYMCQATNIGGEVRDISSLIVQEEPTPTTLFEERKFFTFYDFGVAVYEPANCRLHHQIQGTDIIPGTQEYVCGKKDIPCSWGKATNVGTRYIYVSQPERDRVLVISTIQMVVVDVVATDKYPVELHYVPQLDQVWVLNWRYTENKGAKTIQVIRDASQRRKHHTVHPEPIDGQFDLVKDLFVPSNRLEQTHYNYKYGYVTHNNQRGMYKLDLLNLRYTKSVDLTLYNCVPENVEFSALYGFVIVSCREPITNRAQGQIVLDYVSDTVLSTKPELNGVSQISPDSRHLITVEYNPNGVIIVVQKVTPNGLEFLFDVKTSLNISDITFFESENMHGYDVFASTSDKEDILYLNLFTE
ncbi:unnamed protein product [Hermetia illucens]|uniref:Follistatin-related protein 5 n=1 Tax=Hermetia illucens TaxID=343691 RepID=A0A7R8V9F7_HERIL|nr:unnamed protein product [Hermetia illucens]